MPKIRLQQIDIKQFKGLSKSSLNGLSAPWGYGFPYTINVPKDFPRDILISSHTARRPYSKDAKKSIGKDWRYVPVKAHKQSAYSRRLFTSRIKQEEAITRKDAKQDLLDEAFSDWTSQNYEDQYDSFEIAYDSWWQDHAKSLKIIHPQMTEKKIYDKYLVELGGRSIKSDIASERVEKDIEKIQKQWINDQKEMADEAGIYYNEIDLNKNVDKMIENDIYKSMEYEELPF